MPKCICLIDNHTVVGEGDEIARLRARAREAEERADYDLAAEHYRALEKLEPANGDHSRRLGEAYRKLGQRDKALDCWTRAIDKFESAGFTLRAIAVCQMVLRADPEHLEAKARLLALRPHSAPPRPSRQLAAGTRPRIRESRAGTNNEANIERSGLRITFEAPESTTSVSENTRASEYEPDEEPGTIRGAMPIFVEPADSLAHPAREPGAPFDDGDNTLIGITPASGVMIPPKPRFSDISLRDSVHGAHERAAKATDEIDGTSTGVFEIPIADAEPSDSGPRSAIREIPLFSNLSASGFETLFAGMDVHELRAGDVLFRAGDLGRCLYITVEGVLGVYDDTATPRRELARLGEGSIFGEMAIIMEQPRSATVAAREPTMLLSIDAETIMELIVGCPEVLQGLLRFIRDRCLDNLGSSHPLFVGFDPAQRDELLAKFRFLEVSPGTELIVQNEPVDGFYVLLAGRASQITTDDDGITELCSLGPGAVAGDRTLIEGGPAQSTLRCESKVLALELPAEEFRELILTHPQVLAAVSDLSGPMESAERDGRDFGDEGSADSYFTVSDLFEGEGSSVLFPGFITEPSE